MSSSAHSSSSNSRPTEPTDYYSNFLQNYYRNLFTNAPAQASRPVPPNSFGVSNQQQAQPVSSSASSRNALNRAFIEGSNNRGLTALKQPKKKLDSSDEIKYRCPVCLDSIKNRKPVSTQCGHVFCEECIQAAFGATKKCPMCQKKLNSKFPFHRIFIDN